MPAYSTPYMRRCRAAYNTTNWVLSFRSWKEIVTAECASSRKTTLCKIAPRQNNAVHRLQGTAVHGPSLKFRFRWLAPDEVAWDCVTPAEVQLQVRGTLTDKQTTSIFRSFLEGSRKASCCSGNHCQWRIRPADHVTALYVGIASAVACHAAFDARLQEFSPWQPQPRRLRNNSPFIPIFRNVANSKIATCEKNSGLDLSTRRHKCPKKSIDVLAELNIFIGPAYITKSTRVCNAAYMANQTRIGQCSDVVILACYSSLVYFNS